MHGDSGLGNLGCALARCFGFFVAVIFFWPNMPVSAAAMARPFTFSLTPSGVSDSIQTTRQYFAVLATADTAVFRREFEYDFLLLLDQQQGQAYDSLATLAERKAYIELYWKALNPDPLLPDNDRLVDHLRRRLYVKRNFHTNKPPFFDDRGKYYLKYGKPSHRYQDPGGVRRVAFFGPAVYPQVMRLYPYKQAPEQYYSVIPNETWSYENVSRDFVVHFMKDGATFREIKSLTEILTGRLRKNISWQWGDLVKERAAASPVMARAAMEVDRFETTFIHAAAFQRRGELVMGEIQAPTERMMETVRQNEFDAEKARLAAPASAHDPIHAINRLAFSENIAQFRAPNGFTRVEITLLAPLAKNLVERMDSTATDTLSIGFAWMLRDQNLDSLSSHRTRSHFPLRLAGVENLPNAVSQVSFLAPPQSAELAMEVRNRRDGRLGFSKKPLTIREFNDAGLMLSDLQLYFEVTNENQSRVLPTLDKQNLLLSPYPYLEVRKNVPLFCYFEIYNLTAAGITESYEINYKITSDLTQTSFFKKLSRLLTGAKESAISLSHAQPVVDGASHELIAIDLSNLANGAHRLEITVADVKNENVKASVTKEIVFED